MKLFHCVLVPILTLFLINLVSTLSVLTDKENQQLVEVAPNEQIAEKVIRVKRSPLLKLPLILGAGLLAKKALVVGGAAVGAKALVGAGLVGAGLYKAKYGGGYGGYGNYGGGYTSYHYGPPTYYSQSSYWG